MLDVRDWAIIEERAFDKFVDSLSSSDKKTKLKKIISDRDEMNKDLKKDGLLNAELRIRPDDNNYYIRPARPFYEKYPICKFSFGIWDQSRNNFEDVEDAKDAIFALSIPTILEINRGWRGDASSDTVNWCNKKWHRSIRKEVRLAVFKDIIKSEEMPIPLEEISSM